MDPLLIGLIGFGVFLLLLAMGVPVGFSMCLIGFAGFAILVSVDGAWAKLAIESIDNMRSYTLAVYPAFIFMAQIFQVAGLGKDMFTAVEKWLGRLRGGLAIASIVACAIFAAISASSIATLLTIGLVAVPEMLKRKYEPGFSGACLASAGGLGILIPPSSLLIMYGILTENSIKDLFVAGIVPGIILALVYIIVITVMCKKNPELAPRGQKYTMREKLKSLLQVGDVIAVIVIALAGLFLDLFTPTEAGAFGAGGAFLVAVLRKRLTWKGFKEAVRNTVTNTGSMGIVLIGAMVFNYFITASGIPQALVNLIMGGNTSRYIVFLFLTIMYLILGMFMDSFAMVVLTLSFVYPIATAIGFNPIAFGVYIVLVAEMGSITPPVGINVFVAGGLHEALSSEKIFRRVIPFVICQLIVIALIVLFPQLASFLPSIM